MFKSFSRTRSYSGMTLIELMAVIAIVAVLIGMLLPAVQAARETARRMQCQNNLRQIGLAIHNYHDAHRIMPPGCLEWRPWRGSPHLKNYAWSALLLPYIEQQNLGKLIDYNYAFDHPRNLAAGSTDLAVYTCPSARLRESNMGRSDYGGLFGQRINTRSNTDNGVFVYNTAFRFSDISDGLTNTLAVAEDALGPDAQWINGRNVFEQSGGVNDPAAWIGDNEIRSDHHCGAMAVFSCGRVQFLSDSIDRQVLAALITRNGGEISNFNE